MYRFGKGFFVVCSEESGAEYGGSSRKTYKQVDYQCGDRACGTYRRKGVLASEFSHDHNVGGIEKHLQYARDKYGNGEADEQGEYGSLAHIQFI